MSYPLNDGVVLPIITGLLVLGNFVRGGWVDRSLLYVGAEVYYWSRISRSNVLAYRLAFNSSYVAPSIDATRLGGFSLRCVAIGS